MAILFTLHDPVVNDQSLGLQTGDSGDGYTDTDVAYSTLPAAFKTYLETTLGLNNAFPTSIGVGTKTNSVTVNASANGSLTDIVFTDGGGGALTGDPATDDSGLNTIDGHDILLVADGDDIVLGKYDSDGNGSLDSIAFVIFKQDVYNAAHTSAQVTFHIVTYVPIDHPDGTDPDDAVDLGNTLKIAASEFVQLDFADLPSGQNLHGTIAIDKTDLSQGGLLLFPKNALLNPDGTMTNMSPTTNTSKGGGDVTIGNTNQMFDPTEGHYFIYVDNPVPASVAGVGLDQNNADDADTIGFNGTNPQTAAQVEVVQVQGNTLATMKITAYDFTFSGAVDTNAEARDLVTDPLALNGTVAAPTSAVVVNIDYVKVYNGAGTLIEHWQDLDHDGVYTAVVNSASVGVTFFNTGGGKYSAQVSGIDANYTIEWGTQIPHDGVLIEDIAGKYDLGGFNLLNTTGESEFVGQQIVIEDDGPTAAITDTGKVVIHDETAGVQDGTEAADILTIDTIVPDPHTDNDQSLATIPLAFSSLGVAIGWAQNPSAVVTSAGSSYGTDGAGTESWSLGVPADDTDSGFLTLDGHKILLNVEGGIVVGRIDADDNDDVDGGDDVAIAISLSQSGILSVAQYVPIAHTPDTGPDQQAAMIDSALVATLTVTDADGDSNSISENIGDKVIIEDDGPDVTSPGPIDIEEDDLDNAKSVGNNEDGSVNAHIDVTNFGSIITVQPGVDAPVTFSLSNSASDKTALAAANVGLTSKGGTILFDVNTGTNTVTGYVESGNAVGLDALDRTVFTWQVTSAGVATFTDLDQIDHALLPAGENFAIVNLSAVLDAQDGDGDPVPLGNDFAEYRVQDDIPIIAELVDGTPNPISDGLVDFANGDSVTNSLHGLIGTDENVSGSAKNGTKTYTFDFGAGTAQDTIGTTSIAGLTAVASADLTKIEYFAESNGVAGFQADEKYFDIVLGDQSADGDYTFTVYKDPPPALLEFDFTDLPSGQNLFGIIAANKGDLSEGGLLLFPKGTLLNADGTMTNMSPTTNTSKGGGPVTIGNTNQMFDPGEGHYFLYVDNPNALGVAGLGLDQNNADDADTIGFNGTMEVNKAEVEIVQVQGGSPASFKISAYDVSFDNAVDTNAEARDLVTDPLDQNGTDLAPKSVTAVNIDSVTVFNAAGDAIEYWQDLDHNGLYQLADSPDDPDALVDDAAGVNVVFNLISAGVYSATVSGIDDDYSVQFTTQFVHDMQLVEGVAGKYDIGGINLLEAQPTPDQRFDYTVAITDYDLDRDTSNEFSIGVDGTGPFDDDMVAGVIA